MTDEFLEDDHPSKAWAEFRAEIDRRLDALRPERAGVSERDWREPVYGWARNHMPDESNLVRHFAQAEVDRREGLATKRGNKELRRYAKGIVPLEWALIGPLPIKVGDERVRLDVATPDDVDDAARELRDDAKQVFDEVVLLADVMQDLARSTRHAGKTTVRELGDLPARDGDSDGSEE